MREVVTGKNFSIILLGDERSLLEINLKYVLRLFIMKKDGSGSELLRENEIKDYIHQSEIDALTAVVRETLFGNNEATGWSFFCFLFFLYDFVS